MNEKSAPAGRCDSQAPGAQTCPRCGAGFVCGMAAGESHCWCSELPAIAPPDPDLRACLCPDCLRAVAQPVPPTC